MKRLLLMGLVALLSTACAQSRAVPPGTGAPRLADAQAQQAASAASYQPAPLGTGDDALYGIRVGMTLAAARQYLTNPVLEQTPDATYWRDGDPQAGVEVYVAGDVVWQVRSFVASTQRDLRVGDSATRVRGLYGEPHHWDADRFTYDRPDGLTLQVDLLGGRVRSITVANPRLRSTPAAVEKVPPLTAARFGKADHALAGVEICAPLPTGWHAPDAAVQVVQDAAGRVLRVGVRGARYATVRGVRVGDSLDRIEQAYGGYRARVYPQFGDTQALLTFQTDDGGRITEILLTCR